MSIIAKKPDDLSKLGIYKALLSKSTPENSGVEKVTQFIEAVTPLVDLIIAGPFREFTLHNRDHASKMLHILDYIVPQETFARLSILDCLLIFYSAYLHDMGMSLTSTERERLLSSDEFLDSLREWPEIWNSLENARKTLKQANLDEHERFRIESEIFQLHEAALCRYLRPRHATSERYRELTALIKQSANRTDLFEMRGVSFEDNLIDVCMSHNLDVGVLAEVHGTYDERFPRDLSIGGEKVNTQFCAILLRVSDILDFDRERTPKILFDSLGIESRHLPGADVTLKEWQKHMAVHTMEVAEEEIIVTAESRHPVIEKAIRDFCYIIERELRDTISILKRNTPQILAIYHTEWPISVRCRIKSIGYVTLLLITGR